MEKTLEVNVKVVSNEFLKPSIRTASHRKFFKMCYLDQMLPLNPPFLTSVLLCYTNTNQLLDITRLKTSLSKSLTSFYPLAGRVKQSTITCNDLGLPFIEAHVDCPLSIVLNSPRKLELVTKFLPPRAALGVSDGGDELVHMAIQVNVFTCGGVVIGWYDIHKIMDGTSSSTFFKHWATLASQKLCHEGVVVQPEFEAPVAAFPPLPVPRLLPLADDSSKRPSNIVVKTFTFTNHSITDLRARASSEAVPNPSRYQALAGFIWEQLKNEKKTDDTVLQVTLDMRPFTNPPLPKGSIGNLIDTAVARAEASAKLPELVAQIHGAITEMKGDIKEHYHGEKGVEAVRASWDKLITTLTEYQERAYKVVSWCKLFSDVDFGFGKPACLIPTDGIMSPFHKDLVILNDFTDSNGESGIEAWFFLEEIDMAHLVSSPQFFAFASPVKY